MQQKIWKNKCLSKEAYLAGKLSYYFCLYKSLHLEYRCVTKIQICKTTLTKLFLFLYVGKNNACKNGVKNHCAYLENRYIVDVFSSVGINHCTPSLDSLGSESSLFLSVTNVYYVCT